MRRLDPRDPFVVDTRELGRRPGAMREIVRTAPAPHDLAIPVIAIAPDTPIELALRLESVVEGVLVSGQATTTARGECVRCLDGVTLPVVLDLQELYDYPDKHDRYDRHDKREASDDEEDAETRLIVDDLIDLEPLIRDLAVLALPLKPLCAPDCPGLCSECGARLADDPQHSHEMLDPRWAELASLNSQSKYQSRSQSMPDPQTSTEERS